MYQDLAKSGLELAEDHQKTPISRRSLLWKGAPLFLAAGAGLSGIVAATHAAAASSVKISQDQARYQSTPRGNARCDKCVQFQAPSACKLVDGVVSPSGCCNFFAPRPA